MRTARLLLLGLLSSATFVHSANLNASAENSETIILTEFFLDKVTAGAVSSVTMTEALASGMTFAETKTQVMSDAYARQGNWSTHGKGSSTASGNGFAYTAGSSSSQADSTGVDIQGDALAIDSDASALTKIWTQAIDTRYAEIAIGHVRSVACCGSDTDTNVQASTFTDQAFSVSRITLNEVNTPRLAHSIGNVVIISISHP
ncbi:MAG: hypothetical protein ACU83N_06005 [Gammaproteobacteria bacterium]